MGMVQVIRLPHFHGMLRDSEDCFVNWQFDSFLVPTGFNLSTRLYAFSMAVKSLGVIFQDLACELIPPHNSMVDTFNTTWHVEGHEQGSVLQPACGHDAGVGKIFAHYACGRW